MVPAPNLTITFLFVKWMCGLKAIRVLNLIHLMCHYCDEAICKISLTDGLALLIILYSLIMFD